MNRKKVCYIISDINKAVAFEWITERLDPSLFQLSFILLNAGTSELEKYLMTRKVPVRRVAYKNKKDFFKALYRITRILCKEKVELIHCHMFEATLLGLLAGKISRVKKRIYTRHHSTYNWKYNPGGIKYDRITNWLATDIIAISENVKDVLLTKENVSPKKVHLIHHGFDLQAFSNVETDRIEKLRKKYNPSDKHPVIGVIARWVEWKGIQYIIPAFKKLLVDYPEALLILANATGNYDDRINKLLANIPEKNYQLIEFENDMFALYRLFDVYVHTPIDPEIEAFGQTYIEALASGIPSIFTHSGVAPEFIEHEKNALLVPFAESESIDMFIGKLIKNRRLREELIRNGNETVKRFELTSMINKLENLYA